MPAIIHQNQIIGQATNAEALVKDTVGWTGKNLFNIPSDVVSGTYRNVDYTVNRNSNNAVTSIVVNNQAQGGNAFVSIRYTLPAGDYIFSSCPSGGSGETYNAMIQKTDGTNTRFDFGDGVLISIAETTEFYIYPFRIVSGYTANNLVFKPMICRADITDPTYEPYHESVEVMHEEEIHGVNLLKNEATTQTVNGVTFTVNVDGSVTVNGTATADASLIIYNGQKRTDAPFKNIPVILSKGNEAFVANTSLYCNVYQGTTYVRTIANCQGVLNTESDVFEVDYNGYDGIRVGIVISNGVTLSNAVFRPMLRKADIEDSTYRPYNYQAIQNQLNAQGVLGAKNLLLNEATSQTINGVTFTVNADKSVTVNGTATDDIRLRINPATNTVSYNVAIPIDKGSYILSGGTSNIQLRLNGFTDSSASNAGLARSPADSLQRDKFSITTDTARYNVFAYIASGTTISNEIIYPMIRLASDPDDTYQPYTMTNRELTEKLYFQVGEMVDVTGSSFAAFISSSATEIVFTIPLHKDLSRVTGISFASSTRLSVRTPSGGYILDTVAPSAINLSIRKMASNMLSLSIKKQDGTAFDNITNNSLLNVAFTMNTSIITFS